MVYVHSLVPSLNGLLSEADIFGHKIFTQPICRDLNLARQVNAAITPILTNKYSVIGPFHATCGQKLDVTGS